MVFTSSISVTLRKPNDMQGAECKGGHACLAFHILDTGRTSHGKNKKRHCVPDVLQGFHMFDRLLGSNAKTRKPSLRFASALHPVGVERFELSTSSSRTTRANRAALHPECIPPSLCPAKPIAKVQTFFHLAIARPYFETFMRRMQNGEPRREHDTPSRSSSKIHEP